MGFVSFDKTGHLLDAAGNQVHIVGINYVTSYICTNFWEDWRPDHIERDLKTIHEMGLQAVRIPMHWGFMEPEAGRYNPVFEERFRAFVEMCRKYELYIMPWFLVGIATREYDVPFRNGRPFFSGEMVQIEEAHLKHFIAPYKDEELILFWDICDEPEWYSRFYNAEQLPFSRTEMARWVKSMYDAIRSVDQNHLITLGFSHIAADNYGMDVRDMADILDLMVITAYPGSANEGIDSCRNNYCIPYHVKMNSRGKPTFACEAPGYSSIACSKEIIGRYFKASLYGNLLSGSTGVMPWVFTDFEESLWNGIPFEKYPIEPNFGIFTADGCLKPSGQVLKDYAAFAKKAQLGKYRPQKAEVAILVPDGYYPNVEHAMNRIYTAMLLAKGCGAAVDLVWTTEELSGYKLLLMPTFKGMTTSSWDKVRRFVEDGGILYFTYEAGLLSGYFNRLFGVEVQTPEKDFGYQAMHVKEDWGHWKQGDVIPMTGKDRKDVLRVRPENARVLCTFEDGEAALLKNAYGKGHAYLATSPLDNGLMEIRREEYLQTRSFDMLDAIMTEAGISRVINCDHPAVEAGCLVKDESGEMLAILLNHDNREVRTVIRIDSALIPAGWEVRRFEDGRLVCDGEPLTLEPAGVLVCRIVPSAEG